MNDLMHMLMVASDPYISSLRKSCTVKQSRTLVEEVRPLLLKKLEDTASDTRDEEIDTDEEFFNFNINEDLLEDSLLE